MQQTTNASKRLKATFVDKVDADGGVGGAANTVDLVRCILNPILTLLYPKNPSAANHKRQQALKATFVDKVDADGGGAANMVDLVRCMVQRLLNNALPYCCQLT